MEKIFDNKNAILYNLSSKVPHCMLGYYKGFYEANDPEVMRVLEFCLTYVPEHNIQILISDHSKLESASEDIYEYSTQIWYPHLIKHGLLAEIYIDAEDFMGRLAVEELFEQIKQSKQEDFITIKVETLEEAKKQAKQLLEAVNR
ncbi:MAG: hypothetical protein JJT94_02690 [Bernardetiaceae bacterium]|nr:hypothetical protein [Bernardetiaceae bacterium]